LGARLSSIKLIFQSEEGLKASSSKLVNYIDEAIKETREISHNLSTDMLTRFGLQTALKDTIRTIQNSNQIEADLAVYGMDSRWPLAIERNIFYILLELLNNTIKHSGAKKLMVQISQIKEEVNIFYEDDGKGFDEKDTDSKGMGMRSMKARVNAIKADMRIETKAKSGFSAVISLQVSEAGSVSSASSPQSPASHDPTLL
jgi:signal transduction histidine kinase